MSTVTYVPLTAMRSVASLPSQNTIQFVQAQIGAPETPITFWTFDSNYAPFDISFQGVAFPGGDPGLSVGYNTQFQNPSEPQAIYQMELDFQPAGPSTRQIEMYWQINTHDLTGFVRPFSATWNRASHNTAVGVSYKNGTSGSGTFTIGGVESGQQAIFNDGGLTFAPASYQINSNAFSWIAAGNFAISSTGSFSLGTASGAAQLQAGTNITLIAGGSGATSEFAFDAMVLANHSQTNVGVIDNVNVANQCRIYPWTDNTGSVGISTNAWSNVVTYGITMQTAAATSATAGTHGAVPSQVAGYMSVTVAGTSYKVPLFNP